MKYKETKLAWWTSSEWMRNGFGIAFDSPFWGVFFFHFQSNLLHSKSFDLENQKPINSENVWTGWSIIVINGWSILQKNENFWQGAQYVFSFLQLTLVSFKSKNVDEMKFKIGTFFLKSHAPLIVKHVHVVLLTIFTLHHFVVWFYFNFYSRLNFEYALKIADTRNILLFWMLCCYILFFVFCFYLLFMTLIQLHSNSFPGNIHQFENWGKNKNKNTMRINILI